ncbi:tubulin-like doman-containing protein [Sphaerotilus sp.]|uniref:tubulin-like doman-containing protein n=1 Tax=Sphaerotilus sp. TaxID=2093942 RepID=UPI00286DA867|nr:tubulin-like doman-containing protein [Sphaerotilus sp.]
MNHLILGLGGAGVRVWQALQQRLQSRAEGPPVSRRPAVEAVLLDTDARALADNAPGWRVLGVRMLPPAAQRVLLTADSDVLTSLLQARTDLRSTVAPDGQGWAARLQQLGAFDAPLSQVGERLPGWPTRRLGRLLLALHQARVRCAVDAAVQALQARTSDPALTVHVVAHLGGTTGAGLLLDVLALLQRYPPAQRCVVQVHVEMPDHDTAGAQPVPLAEVQAYAALRELQAAAQSGWFSLCFLGAMTDERGLQPFDAAGREQRLADWLFHRVGEAKDLLSVPARTPAAVVGARVGEFAAFGVAERSAERHAVRAHLSHELMLRLLAQLRYNHWRAGLGFVTHPRATGSEALGDLLNAWGLSDAHVQLAVPLPEIDGDTLPTLSIEQEWKMLEVHFVSLIALVAPARRINELRRLFDQGLAERFRGQGIESVFDQPDHTLRRRAVVVRQRVENSLWDDWRQGRRALHECGQLLAAVLADLADRIEPLRQEQRGLETQATVLNRQLDTLEQAATGPLQALGLLRGARERDLSEATALLREYALARTRSSAIMLSLRLLAEVQSQLTTLQGMVDAGEMAVATLAEETDVAATAALPPLNAADADGRLDTRELLAHWRTQLVTRESVQREHLRVLRAGLFTQLGEHANFRVFAQRIGEQETCDALLGACARRLPPSALQPVVSAAWDAWVMRLHGESDAAARDLSTLLTRASAGLAWLPAVAGTVAKSDLLRVPAPPRPEALAEEADTPALDAAADGDGEQIVIERPAPRVVLALPGVAELIHRISRTQMQVQELPEGQGELVLLRVVRGLPLQALPRVQELHLRHEAHRLQAGRAALWLQLDDHAALPELLAADAQAQKARARTVVLLAEAFGLLREDTDPVSNEPVLLHVRLDEDGFELDRVCLGRGPAEAVEEARERVLHDLHDAVTAILRTRDMQQSRAQTELRDAMRQRIELLRSQAQPEQRDTISREWNDAARAAMKLARQETVQ